MADASVLKEFLVAIGWKNDDVAMRKAIDSIEKIGKKLAELATVATATATGAVYALDKMAQSFERAYYQSARTGSSVREIKSFSYAVSQLGGNAEDAVAALESLSEKLKSNPNGYRALLRKVGGSVGVGIDTEHGTEKAMEGLSVAMSKMDSLHQRMWAGELGINETLLNAIVNFKELQKYQQEYVDKARLMGVDLQQAAFDGKSLAQSFRTLGLSFSLLFDRIGSKLFRDLDGPLKRLGDYIDRHGDEIAQVVTDIAKALLAMFSYIIEHLPDVERFVKSIGGWQVVLTALSLLLVMKVLGPLGSFFGLLSAITKIVPPGWLLGLIGTAGALGGAAAGSMAYGESQGFSPEVRGALAAEGAKGGGGSLMDRVKRRMGLGDKSAPVMPDGKPGTYRPSHALSDADLSAAVVNTIAGEAQNNQTSTDAVINNMMNRLGTTAYGPSGNLAQVARAHGQYAGYRVASASQAAFIRSRIKAIASGAVPDNTNGSNEYRAGSYAGPWGRKHANNPVIGGNRFGYNPAGGKGAYAPYDAPRTGGVAPFSMPNISNPMAISPYSFAPSLGLSGPQSMNDNRVHMAPNTTINVSGVGDPHAAAAQVASNMTRQHSTLLRNLQSAIG